MDKPKAQLLICFENGRSGETHATEEIAHGLADNKSFIVSSISRPTLTKSDISSVFLWLVGSLITWGSIISYKHPKDYVYTTTYVAGLPALILKKLLKYKLLYHHHGSRIPDTPSESHRIGVKLTQSLKYNIIYKLHWWFLSGCDLIITPSFYTKGWLLSRFPILNEKNIVVIQNGVDTQKYHPLPKAKKIEVKEKLNIAAYNKVLLYVGTLHIRKQINKILMVFSEFKKLNPNSLLIIAHPKYIDTESIRNYTVLKKLQRKLNLTESVMFLENYKNLNEIYNASNIVVLLSNEEHFPLVLLETFASKTLFASSPTGDIKDLLYKIDKSLVFDSPNPKDIARQIVKLLNLPAKTSNSILKKELKIAENNSWQKVTADILGHLKEMGS